ncbi:Nickel transport ATP-binding protein NikE (TC 3.A.1.5.3) [Raoultella ornithinolytica]|nr:Nickel transport ATP-binding protein NikE (TC 3.A.1.5.3) [Raoultella ornithinolytica]
MNPRKTVNEIISEPLRHLFRFARDERQARVEAMMQAVDLSPHLLDKRPHQLSGGSCSGSAWPGRWLCVPPY